MLLISWGVAHLPSSMIFRSTFTWPHQPPTLRITQVPTGKNSFPMSWCPHLSKEWFLSLVYQRVNGLWPHGTGHKHIHQVSTLGEGPYAWMAHCGPRALDFSQLYISTDVANLACKWDRWQKLHTEEWQNRDLKWTQAPEPVISLLWLATFPTVNVAVRNKLTKLGISI